MSGLRIAIAAMWITFWIYWLVSAFGVKHGSRTIRVRAPSLVLILAFLLTRIFTTHTAAVHSLVLEVMGLILLVCGLGVAVWARLNLGRNWGMPMTRKEQPELVTSGPYSVVRHPIYSGILLAVFGTALATNLYWFIAFLILGGYFYYSATVEEKLMTESFPDTYPSYRAKTKMLIPYLL